MKNSLTYLLLTVLFPLGMFCSSVLASPCGDAFEKPRGPSWVWVNPFPNGRIVPSWMALQRTLIKPQNLVLA